MFGLFKRKKATKTPAAGSPLYQVPAHLTSLITIEEYNQILRLTIGQLSLKGTIEAIHDDGSLSVAFAGRCWRLGVQIGQARVRLDWPDAVAVGSDLAFSLPPARCVVLAA